VVFIPICEYKKVMVDGFTFINFDINSLAIERLALGLCLIFAFLTKYKLWKIYENKKKGNQAQVGERREEGRRP
jgi:hypothetical protein